MFVDEFFVEVVGAAVLGFEFVDFGEALGLEGLEFGVVQGLPEALL